jgi:hypothetical protein
MIESSKSCVIRVRWYRQLRCWNSTNFDGLWLHCRCFAPMHQISSTQTFLTRPSSGNLQTRSLWLHQPFTRIRDPRTAIWWPFTIEEDSCISTLSGHYVTIQHLMVRHHAIGFLDWYFCSRSNTISMHETLSWTVSIITNFHKQITDTFTSLVILVDVSSSSYREGVQDNNWRLNLQVMSFICIHFALWVLHVITVKCGVSLREDSHFARFASELFRTML